MPVVSAVVLVSESMNVRYFFFQFWQLIVDHALPLVALLLMAILVPRVGRLVIRLIDSRLDDNEESTKTRLALAGALVYVAQAVAYFLLAIAALTNVGVPALGAAIPATVVSAALGFGAQKIIGDFLAGFFILSEKQYGVGDYVSFDGTSAAVEGTVVALTLRTTKVRTPTGEVVMVPNGSGGVVTNYSQDWSRAVVDLQVPVRAGETLSEVTRKVEEISSHAAQDAAIAEDIAGEIEILPVTGLIEPTVAGQPWQIKYRVMVVVNPSRQWAVERGIRSALVAAFWDHYNVSSAAPLADAPITAVPPAPAESARAGAPTEVMPAAAGTDKAEVRDAVANAAARDSHDPSDQGPGRPSESDPDVAAQHPDVSQTEVMNAVDEAPRTIWRDDHPTTRWGKLWTLGGRVRGSTTGLLVGLAVTGLLLLFSANPEDADAGWLSPSYWTSKSSETESAATTAPATTAATQPEESVEPTQGTVEQPTDASEATATDGPTAAQDNGTTAEQATTTARRERAARRDREDEETPAATTQAATTAPAEEPTVEPTGAAEQPTGAAALTGDAEATAAQ